MRDLEELPTSSGPSFLSGLLRRAVLDQDEATYIFLFTTLGLLENSLVRLYKVVIPYWYTRLTLIEPSILFIPILTVTAGTAIVKGNK